MPLSGIALNRLSLRQDKINVEYLHMVYRKKLNSNLGLCFAKNQLLSGWQLKIVVLGKCCEMKGE